MNGELLINNREEVLKALDKTEKDVCNDVDIVKNWIKSQTQLPEIPNDRLIENFLITNKFSIEITKAKLEMYYSIRSLVPECFKDKTPNLAHMQEIMQIVYYFPLPNLTKDLYRVNITKIRGEPKLFDVYNFFGYQINVNEVRLQEEINLGDVLIVDLEEVKLGHLVKVTPVHLKKAVLILEKVFSSRIKQIHLINVPAFIDRLILLLKTVMKQKIFNRIHIHKTRETLLQYISVEILPKEYGGNQLSLDTFKELWKKKLEQYSERFDKLEKMQCGKALHDSVLKNDDVLGYYGNFKSLDVD